MSFCKSICKEIKLSGLGYRVAKGGEGVEKIIDKNYSIYFHLNGSFSHLELFFGIRYQNVTDLVVKTMKKTPHYFEQGKQYNSRLVGLFYKKVGDFCSVKEHIGIYCPKDSILSNSKQVISKIDEICIDFVKFNDLSRSIDYIFENNLLKITDNFYLPASLFISERMQYFEQCVDFFKNSNRMIVNEHFFEYIDKLDGKAVSS